MAKKNLDESIVNAANFFFSQPEEEPEKEPEKPVKKEEKAEKAPAEAEKVVEKEEKPAKEKRGTLDLASLRKEAKSKKVLLYLKPSQYDKVRRLAEDNDISVNGLFTYIIDKFLEEND